MLSFFWKTDESDFEAQEKSSSVTMFHDGKWHTYSVELPIKGHINSLRFDPASDEGTIEIDWFKAEALTFHPVEVIKVISGNKSITAIVTNHSNSPVSFKLNKKQYKLKAKSALEINKKLIGNIPFETVQLKLIFDKNNIPALVRPVSIVNWNAKTDWLTITNENIRLQISRDGTGAKIFYKDSVAAVISPLASYENEDLELSD